MQALVRTGNGPGEFELREVPEPAVRPGTVKLAVAYAGICGTDLHMYRGELPTAVPMVLGHEFSGTVREVGDGVEGLAPGDRVTVEHTCSVCGTCVACRSGRTQLCPARKALGFEEAGAFAPFVLVSPEYVHRLPENVGLRAGALTEPLACAVHAVEMVNPQAGTQALVVGPGPVGLLVAQVLRAYGCRVTVTGTDRDRDRMVLAGDLGFAGGEEAPPQSFGLAMECSGTPGGTARALEALAGGGTMVQVGITGAPVPFDTDAVVFRELRVQGTFCHNRTSWQRALALESAGFVDVLPLLSCVCGIGEWEWAFRELAAARAVKILFALEGEEGNARGTSNKIACG